MLTGHCQYNSKTPKNTMKEGLKQWIVGALVGMAGRFQGSDLDELLKLEPSDISEIAEALHERLAERQKIIGEENLEKIPAVQSLHDYAVRLQPRKRQGLYRLIRVFFCIGFEHGRASGGTNKIARRFIAFFDKKASEAIKAPSHTAKSHE